MSLAQVSPNLDFWSDTSDVGWGAHLGGDIASGLWSPQDADLSINARELLVVERGLHQFAHLIVNSTVTVFVDSYDCSGVSAQTGRHAFSSAELHRAEDPSVGRVSAFGSGSSVHHGEKQRPRRLSVQAQSDPGLRMDIEVGGLPGAA